MLFAVLVFTQDLFAQDDLQPAKAEDELLIELTGSESVDAEYQLSRTDDGKIVGVFPSPIRVSYRSADMLLLADAAVIWVQPREGEEESEAGVDLAEDFLNNIQSIEIYAEGHIWLRYGKDTAISADRLYLDLARGQFKSYRLRGAIDNMSAHSNPKVLRERSLRLDPIERDEEESDGFVLEEEDYLFMRAKRLKIFELVPDADGRTVIELEDGRLTANSLAVPSYSVGADRIRIELTRFRRTLTLDDPSVYLYGTRILTLPAKNYHYDLDSEVPRVRLSLSDSDTFGTSFRSQLDVITAYDFLFDPQPTFRPFKFLPQFDNFSKRGIGSGAELNYGRENVFGDETFLWIHGYHIQDSGDKRDVARDLGFFPLRSADRGRLKLYGRSRLSDDLQIESNLHYTSDATFIEEFYEGEFDDNLPQRSFILGRKDFQGRSYYLEVSPRLRTYVDEVERLPVVGFSTYRERVGPRALGTYLSAEAEGGVYRIRTEDGNHAFDEYAFTRADAQALLTRPFDFGLFSIEPGVGLRATVSDKTVTAAQNPSYDEFTGFVPPAYGRDAVKDELATRMQGLSFVDFQTNLVRTYPGVISELFDMRGMRHIITAQYRWENTFWSSSDARRFIQIDDVAAADSYQRMTVSLRNRFQTRRTSEGVTQTVDVLDVLMEIPIYPNRRRDNGGRGLGDAEVSINAQPSRDVTIRGGTFWNMRTFEWRRIYGAGTIRIDDELSATVFGRLMEGQHEVVGGSIEAVLSPTYAVSARQEYDIRGGQFRDTVVTFSRLVFDAFTFNFSVRRDAIREDLGFSLSLSAQFGPAKR